jgi:hypothetical protein
MRLSVGAHIELLIELRVECLITLILVILIFFLFFIIIIVLFLSLAFCNLLRLRLLAGHAGASIIVLTTRVRP